jgi:hypothetical protein
MSDQNPSDEEKLTEEFRNLGKNIFGMIQAAWDHPERKNMQQEIESGLRELGNSLRREVEDFSSSSAGEQLKSDIEDLGDRFRTGEAQTRLREELLSALRSANVEMQRAIQRLNKYQSEDKQQPPNQEA